MESALTGKESARFAGRLAAVRLVGEPFRSTFEAKRLPEWLAQRGFRLERDESTAQAGARLLQVDIARTKRLRAALSHFALARRL